MTPSSDNRFEDFFGNDAYVSLKNHLYNYLLRRRAVRKYLQSDMDGLILEIGSGLSPMAEPSDGVVYSELSFHALRKLRQGYEKGYFVVADAAHLPFKAGSFSQVICSEVLEHLPDDRSALREIATVMSQGGSLILTFPHRRFYFAADDRFVNHYRRYELHEVKMKLMEVGLKTLEVQKVLGPLEKMTMLTVISLLVLFIRSRRGKQKVRNEQQLRRSMLLVTIFSLINRFYCVPAWLDAQMFPKSFAAVLLIIATRQGKNP